MTAPIFMALISAHCEKSEPLFIPQENSKNPRYFAMSFCKMMEQGWKQYDGYGNLVLSKREKVLEADKEEIWPNTICNEMVCAWEKDFVPLKDITFKKEIYARQNASFISIPSIRAVACQQNLYIGANTHIVRWADAVGNITVEENCNLGVSVTAENVIRIGKKCSFFRLYAKEIVFDAANEKLEGSKSQQQQNETKKSLNRNQDVYKKIERNIRYVNEKNTDENQHFNASIVTKHKLTILSGCVVQGDVRSHKSIRLDRGTVVCGNLFAEGNVFLEKGACVYGNIFTQNNIFIGDKVCIGQYGKIKSVIAREHIRIGHDCAIYGLIRAEKGGSCCLNVSEIKESIPQKAEKTEKTEKAAAISGYRITMDFLEFSDPKEFQALSHSCFRRQNHLASISIPQGVEELTHSFFYECKNLKRVVLPQSLRKINEFAFYGCEQLQEVIFIGNSCLEEIGNSVFEGCIRLTEVRIPGSVNKLGEAIFRNCSALTTVEFEGDTVLNYLPSHLFQNCKNLENLQLTCGEGGITSIGVSTFYGCEKLMHLALPKTITEIGAYAFEGCGYQPPHLQEEEINPFAQNVAEKTKTVQKKKFVSQKKKYKIQFPTAVLLMCCTICAIVMYKMPQEISQKIIVSKAELQREANFAQNSRQKAEAPVILPLLQKVNTSIKEPVQIKETETTETTEDSTNSEPEKVLDITSDYVVMNTRVMRRYSGTQKDIASAAQSFNQAFESLPAEMGKYYLAAPDALSIETGAYSMYSNGYEQAVHDIYDRLSPDIVTVDAFDTLRAHKEEQMFLKTDIMWTAMGAYYAANEFLAQLEIAPVPLTEYKKESVQKYVGALDPKLLGYPVKSSSDSVDFYVWRENNTAQITKMVKNQQKKYEAPTMALSRGGYNVFIGAKFDSAVLYGAPQATRTLLMVGGRMSHGLAVWLTPYFKNVILLNDDTFYLGNETMEQYLDKYNVTDVMIVGEAETIYSLTAQQYLIRCFIPE